MKLTPKLKKPAKPHWQIRHFEITHTMTTKLQVFVTGAVSAVTTFLGWFVTLPPNQQGDIIAPIIAVVPVTWQAGIAVVLKVVGAVSGLYATFKAAQSGPQSPPKNPPN